MERLPATIIEHLRLADPDLLKAALADAERLRPEPFRTEGPADGAVGPLIEGKVDKYLAAYAARHRLPREIAAERLLADPPEQLRAALEGTSLLYNLLVNWHLAGKQLFHVLPALAARLMDTSVKAPVELVRLPFRTIMLVYDDQASFRAFGGSQPKRDEREGALTVMVSELEVGGERRVTFGAARSRGRRMSRQIFRSLLLRDGWSTEEAIATDWRRISGLDHPAESHFLGEGASLSRLVLNTILYLGSASARVSGNRRNDKATQNDLHNFSILQHRRVGEGITYLRGASAQAVEPAGSGAGARRLTYRHLVMGHWKSQPHGSRQAQRRAVWIEPYLRGPDAAETIDRTISFDDRPCAREPGPDRLLARPFRRRDVRSALEAVKSAELVSRRVPQIGQIEIAPRPFPHPWRIFARGSAVGGAGLMPGIRLLRRPGSKPYGAAIRGAGGLPVDRPGDGEHAEGGHVKDPPMLIHFAGPDSKSAQGRIVEPPRGFDVVGSHHDMAKHSSSSPKLGSNIASG